MRAVITAGGKIGGEYARAAGTTVKALAPVRGATMLERAIAAARGAGAEAIAVVGGDEVRAACAHEVERIIPESESGAENLRRALRAWRGAMLYLTSDLPYVDAGSVRDFADRARGALAIALAEHEAFARRFPGAPAGYGIRIGGERVINGGVFFVPDGAASRVEDLASRLFEARKSSLQMAGLAGLGIAVRFAFGALTIGALERRARRVLGIEARAVRRCAPELAYDADDLATYRYACEHS